jgi:hypothetical protein
MFCKFKIIHELRREDSLWNLTFVPKNPFLQQVYLVRPSRWQELADPCKRLFMQGSRKFDTCGILQELLSKFFRKINLHTDKLTSHTNLQDLS